MTAALGWSPGAATGVGSMPGTDVRESTRVVLGELPDLPHLPELPGRGAGADMVGRGAGLLIDLHAEVWPSGWRFAAAAGPDERRARAWLAEDLDTLEELAHGWSGPLKLQVAGPWTLAGAIEVRSGDKALSDPGACRDVTASLAEGVGRHVRDVARRLPQARLIVQLDEPALPAVLAGTVPTASGFGRLPAVSDEDLVAGLTTVLAALPEAASTVVHCCAAGVPFDALRRAGVRAVSCDLALLGEGDVDALATALESGTALLAGVVDAARLDGGSPESSVAIDSVNRVRGLWGRIGLPVDSLAEVVVTPTCGLARSTPDGARAALRVAREVSRRLREDPEGELNG